MIVQDNECDHNNCHSIDERLHEIWRQKDYTAPFFLDLSDIRKIHGEIQEEAGENARSEEGEMNGLSRFGRVRIALHSK